MQTKLKGWFLPTGSSSTKIAAGVLVGWHIPEIIDSTKDYISSPIGFDMEKLIAYLIIYLIIHAVFSVLLVTRRVAYHLAYRHRYEALPGLVRPWIVLDCILLAILGPFYFLSS